MLGMRVSSRARSQQPKRKDSHLTVDTHIPAAARARKVWTPARMIERDPCIGILSGKHGKLRRQEPVGLGTLKAKTGPSEDRFLPDLQPHSPATGQRDGGLEEWQSHKIDRCGRLTADAPRARQAGGAVGRDPSSHATAPKNNGKKHRACSTTTTRLPGCGRSSYKASAKHWSGNSSRPGSRPQRHDPAR
jgi:hypothetical protein